MKKPLSENEFKTQANYFLVNRIKGIINCGKGLYGLVPTNGDISFSVRVVTPQKDTRITIGRYPDMSLAEARKKAGQIKKEQKIKKINAEALNECPTFREYFTNNWFPEKKAKYKVGSSRPSNIKTLYLRTIEPSGLADAKLSDLSPALVCRNIKAVNQTPGNKHNAVSVMNMVLQKAVLEGVIPFNPIANLLSGSESPFPRPPAHGYKFVYPDELREKFFSPTVRTPVLYRCFYLMITLTGFRFGECRFLMWSYCDFEKKIITIPSDAIGANKTQTDYYKPMTQQIFALLNKMKVLQNNGGDYVFNSQYSNKPICEASLREPIKALTSRELDFHGIRKVMRTWFSSKRIAVNIAELALQHDVRSSLEKVYDKYKYIEEMRWALQQWNDYVESQLPQEYLDLIRE